MRRRLVVTAAVAASAVALVPAHAATKPKPKPIKKSYPVHLLPDPTLEATGQLGDGCSGASPAGVDNRTIKIPARGTLKVVLDSPDPTGQGLTDWDLWLIDSDGSVYDGSHGGTSHEEVVDKFKKAQSITIQVCNLIGQPDATVSYVFTYA